MVTIAPTSFYPQRYVQKSSDFEPQDGDYSSHLGQKMVIIAPVYGDYSSQLDHLMVTIAPTWGFNGDYSSQLKHVHPYYLIDITRFFAYPKIPILFLYLIFFLIIKPNFKNKFLKPRK